VSKDEPKVIPPVAVRQARAILDRMSLGSIRRLRQEIHGGNIDGACYGMDPRDQPEDDEPPYSVCFLGWVGFLEQRSAVEVACWARMDPGFLGVSSLEQFVTGIQPGDTPVTNWRSMELWNLVTDVMVEREQAPDPEPAPGLELEPELESEPEPEPEPAPDQNK
jgi:hypothetical protein